MTLSDSTYHKFVSSIPVSDWEILTDTGWKDITQSQKTIPYEVCRIELENGLFLECADTHILIRSDGTEVYAQDSVGVEIATQDGPSRVLSFINTHREENMYDLTVGSNEHVYYTNGILSHNTATVACYICHYVIFNDNKEVCILANKGSAAREVMSRVQYAYEFLPSWLQQGLRTWNKGDIILENGSKIFTSATTPSGPRGKSIAFMYIDEAAIIDNSVAEEFFTSTYPTISSGKSSKIVMTSTPMGYNHFWKFWNDSVQGKNKFVRIEATYKDHPDRSEEWAQEQLEHLGELKFNQEVMCLGGSEYITLLDTKDGRVFDIPIEDAYKFL